MANYILGFLVGFSLAGFLLNLALTFRWGKWKDLLK